MNDDKSFLLLQGLTELRVNSVAASGESLNCFLHSQVQGISGCTPGHSVSMDPPFRAPAHGLAHQSLPSQNPKTPQSCTHPQQLPEPRSPAWHRAARVINIEHQQTKQLESQQFRGRGGCEPRGPEDYFKCAKCHLSK